MRDLTNVSYLARAAKHKCASYKVNNSDVFSLVQVRLNKPRTRKPYFKWNLCRNFFGFRLFQVFKYCCIVFAYFTHIAASTTVTDDVDVTRYVTHRTFNTKLYYSSVPLHWNRCKICNRIYGHFIWFNDTSVVSWGHRVYCVSRNIGEVYSNFCFQTMSLRVAPRADATGQKQSSPWLLYECGISLTRMEIQEMSE